MRVIIRLHITQLIIRSKRQFLFYDFEQCMPTEGFSPVTVFGSKMHNVFEEHYLKFHFQSTWGATKILHKFDATVSLSLPWPSFNSRVRLNMSSL